MGLSVDDGGGLKVRIRVIDLETTGFTPDVAGVCEIGWCDLEGQKDLAGGWINWDVLGGQASLIDPGRRIPPETSAIHHIIDEDVIGRPKWPDGASSAFSIPFMRADIFAAHNVKFEKQWCTDELTDGRPWICTYKASLRLWPDSPSHSNQCLRYWRNPDGLSRDEADRSHRAYPDAYVTAFLLRDMLNDGAAIDDLVRWTEEPALQIRCHIGKNRGLLWSEVDTGFLYWLLDKDFDEDVIFTAKHHIKLREENL